MPTKDSREEAVARRRAALRLLSARFAVASSLDALRRLEAHSHSFVREYEAMQLIPHDERQANHDELFAHTQQQITVCRDKLDIHRQQAQRAVSSLHQCVIRIAELHIDEPAVQRQCERILRLSLPVCPRPGPAVVSQIETVTWLNQTIAAIPTDIHREFLIHVDELWDVLNVRRLHS